MLAKMGLAKEEKKDFFGGLSNNSSSSSSSGSSILPSFQEESAFDKCCPKLTYKQRLYGFCGCAGLGYLLSFVGCMVLVGGMTAENITTFACLYVIGNIIALTATGFLVGPKAQCTKMWAPTRRYSTAFFLTMLIVVFAVAITKQDVVLIIFLLFVEVLAGGWYAASYIPYGRKMILTFLRKTCCGPCFEAYDSMKEGGNDSNRSTFGSSK